MTLEFLCFFCLIVNVIRVLGLFCSGFWQTSLTKRHSAILKWQLWIPYRPPQVRFQHLSMSVGPMQTLSFWNWTFVQRATDPLLKVCEGLIAGRALQFVNGSLGYTVIILIYKWLMDKSCFLHTSVTHWITIHTTWTIVMLCLVSKWG